MILFSPNMDKLSEKEINTIFFFFFLNAKSKKQHLSDGLGELPVQERSSGVERTGL